MLSADNRLVYKTLRCITKLTSLATSACYLLTLSGRIGKVVASHAAVARSSPAEVGLIYTMHVALRGYCP